MIDGEWVKLRAGLPDDPRVLAMAELVGRRIEPRSVGLVVVGLIRLWGAARVLAAEADGGDALLRKATPHSIDAIARVHGLAKALEAVDWLRWTPEGAVLPGFWSNIPDDTRTRASARARMKRYRERLALRHRDVTRDVTETPQVTSRDAPSGVECSVTTPCNTPPDPVTSPAPAPVGASPAAPGGAVDGSTNGHGPQKKPRPAKVVSPEVREVARRFAGWVRRWKPDARPQVESPSSLEQLRLLVESDGRKPDDVMGLLAWLFGGDKAELDYEPKGDGFDWRPNVLSGAKLRKHWDALDALYSRTHPKEPTT